MHWPQRTPALFSISSLQHPTPHPGTQTPSLGSGRLLRCSAPRGKRRGLSAAPHTAAGSSSNAGEPGELRFQPTGACRGTERHSSTPPRGSQHLTRAQRCKQRLHTEQKQVISEPAPSSTRPTLTLFFSSHQARLEHIKTVTLQREGVNEPLGLTKVTPHCACPPSCHTSVFCR